jgi:hypothetical protein
MAAYPQVSPFGSACIARRVMMGIEIPVLTLQVMVYGCQQRHNKHRHSHANIMNSTREELTFPTVFAILSTQRRDIEGGAMSLIY